MTSKAPLTSEAPPAAEPQTASVELFAPSGLGEVAPGTDLAGLVAASVPLRDGDVLVVTSKVVSKSEGRLVEGSREQALPGQTVRVVARRGPTTIVENPLGLVMAAAGIDGSNVPSGTIALLPEDPDRSAVLMREALADSAGTNVAVLVADTAGRAWRTGQTDIAIGLAGLSPTEAFAGRLDRYGNPLAVTEPAVADELAGAAELASGKLGGRPFVIVRGLAERVLPRGEHGPGARALVRAREQDMFALGAREAVVAALAEEQADCFGSPATSEELGEALRRCGLTVRAGDGGLLATARVAGAEARLRPLALAHGWQIVDQPDGAALLRPGRDAPRR